MTHGDDKTRYGPGGRPENRVGSGGSGNGSDKPIDTVALAQITYRLAEFLGHDAPEVRLVRRAAETGDPDHAALAWDAILSLPLEFRRGLARWMAMEKGVSPSILDSPPPNNVIPFPTLRRRQD